jgi:uncharacterized protein YdeI (YjbR/CyaY-like superfamily)
MAYRKVMKWSATLDQYYKFNVLTLFAFKEWIQTLFLHKKKHYKGTVIKTQTLLYSVTVIHVLHKRSVKNVKSTSRPTSL